MRPRRRTATGVLALVLALAAGCGDNAAAQADAGVAPQLDAGVDIDVQADALPPFAIDPARVHADVAWLAAPEREGRSPGMPGNQAALDYVETLFTELGLEPAGAAGTYRQPFAFQAWGMTGPPAVVIAGVEGTYETDFIVVHLSGSGAATAELAFVGHAMTVPAFSVSAYPNCPLATTGYDDFAGIDVTGKIVVALRHGPGDDQRVDDSCPANSACGGSPCLWSFGYKAANAALHGAAALVLVQDYVHSGDLPAGATVGAGYYEADLPVVWSTRAAVEDAVPALPTWAAAIGSTKTPSSHLTGVTATVTTSTAVQGFESENVLGFVPGTDATLGSEVVIVSAHVDHLGVDAVSGTLYPGADDNASGTAVMMELARAAVRGADPPARTLLFAAWNGEEAGLLGSCGYVDEPFFPLADTVAMFSLDMVGSGDGSGVLLYGGDDFRNRWLSNVLADATTEAGLAYAVTNAEVSDASDHYCFFQAGVSALLVMTGPDLAAHAWYHTAEDAIDKITAADLEAAVRVMWAGLQPLSRGAEGSYSARSAPTRARRAGGELAPFRR